jgi:hypothetical protein
LFSSNGKAAETEGDFRKEEMSEVATGVIAYTVK